jgi:hypothetical protein
VISMAVRFRRSGTEQRLQLKWFLYARPCSPAAGPSGGADQFRVP